MTTACGRLALRQVAVIGALLLTGAGVSSCKVVAVNAGGGPGGGAGGRSSQATTIPVGAPSRSGVAEPVPRIAHVRTSRTGYWSLPGGVILPNGELTPGAINPAVTQATIGLTICRTGFTSTIRPDESYTTGLKRRQLAAGYSEHGDQSTGDYEEDHLISLELGGAPSDPRNLWPEPYDGPTGAKVKDLIENKLHDEVCSGSVPLAVAQRDIAGDWWAAYHKYGGAGSPRVWDGRYTGGAPSPAPAPSSAGPTGGGGGVPSGATARCADGTYSYSKHRSGTCAGHGGVDHWIHEPSS